MPIAVAIPLISAGISAAGGIAQAKIAGNAAQKAADTQSNAANQLTQAGGQLLQPYMSTGTSAMNTLGYLMGLNPASVPGMGGEGGPPVPITGNAVPRAGGPLDAGPAAVPNRGHQPPPSGAVPAPGVTLADMGASGYAPDADMMSNMPPAMIQTASGYGGANGRV